MRTSLPLVFMALLALTPIGTTAADSTAACPRIVSQSPYISRSLDWLGLGTCLVGVSRYDERELPRTGGVIDPDADTIALLEPQLMIAPDWTDAATWQAAAPAGARALRVDGFRGMAGVEAMLRDIGRAAGIADIDRRVDRFAADWRAAAQRVGGRGRRVLLLSACGEAPYSFGRGTTLHELFSAAGFQVVADHDSIRNFLPATPDGDVATWITRLGPDLIFAFRNRRDEACNASLAKPGRPIVPLDGELFTHPGPVLLDGLEQLRRVTADLPAAE